MSTHQNALGLREPKSFIPEIDSLRGWAIILVIAFHYFGISKTPQPTDASPAWLYIAAAGNTGVTLFFVLSGFLLSQPFIRALKSGEKVSTKQFYIARLLRIVPLYYLFVCLAWIITGKTSAALKAFMFQHIGFDMFPYSTPWWTLCTEVQFYILLPWLIFILQFRLGYLFLAGGLLAWLTAHFFLFYTPSWMNNPGNWGLQASLFGRGPAFLIGMICAWIQVGSAQTKTPFKPLWAWCGLALLLGCLYQLLKWYAQIGQLPALKALPIFHDIEAVLWGGILLCLTNIQGRSKFIFINSLISHFGTLSYSIYLVHVPVQFYLIYWIQNNPEHWLGAMGLPFIILLSFMLIWALSLATYHGVERPCLRLKSRIPIYSKQHKT